MSSGRVHKLAFIGIFAAIAIYLYYNGAVLDPPTLIVAFLFGVLASVWPDIDISTSPVSHLLRAVLIALAIGAVVVYTMSHDQTHLVLAIVFAIVFFIVESAHHRKFCHSIVFLGIMTLVAYLFASRVIFIFLPIDSGVCALSWFAGQTLHLVMDGEFDDGFFT